MTDAVRQVCRELHDSCEFPDTASIDRYSAAVATLREHRSPEVLVALLTSIRDHDGGEVQYETIEACEEYPAEVYVPTLIACASDLRRNSAEWGRLMIQSVLNTDRYREALIHNLRTRDVETRASVLAWIDEIAAGSPEYRGIFDQFRT